MKGGGRKETRAITFVFKATRVEMELSQEAILTALVEEGGQMKNMEFLSKFKALLNCSDPEDKKHNRELFKTFINNVAVVKDIEEAKYIVLKKKYHYLLTQHGDGRAQENKESEEDKVSSLGQRPKGEENKLDSRAEGEAGEADKAPSPSEPAEPVQQDTEKDSSNTNKPRSDIELAFAGLKYVDVRAKRTMQFVVPIKPVGDDTRPVGPSKPQAQKPCALPLRMPPVIITHSSYENPPKEHLPPSRSMLEPPSSPRYKRRPSTDSVMSQTSPQTRRHCKSMRPVDEHRYTEMLPLETTEHVWLVSSAVGHWGLY